MTLRIAISSGKGGTGKTFVSTNIARVFEKMGEKVSYLDCDVEEPNGHLFLKPIIEQDEDVTILSPASVDPYRCTSCGKCAAVCRYHALALIKKSVLFFQNLCHVCGACTLVCPQRAIIENKRKIGELKHGKSGGIDCCYGLLETGEGGMSVRLIRKVKEYAKEGVTILDSPPGTSCPVIETVKHADLCVLVTDPTPFGINDLKLAVEMCRDLDQEPVIVVNRAEYFNNELKDYCALENLEIVGEIPDERRIAECYAAGDLAVERFPEYEKLFRSMAQKMIERAPEKRPALKKSATLALSGVDTQEIICHALRTSAHVGNGKEVVVISGKGGTGKTSLVACFCALEKRIAISDCDVDAADLHLVLNPTITEKGYFSGGEIAEIDATRCTGCGDCFRACRFNAISSVTAQGKQVYKVEAKSCEGCGVCGMVCQCHAVGFKPAINGEWYVSQTRFGPMSHAKLGIAEGNSGKLVSLIRNKKNELAKAENLNRSIIDGSPGTGCPVIASITGSDYALVVTEPTVSGVHDLRRILDVIGFFKIKSGIVVNKYDLNTEKTAEIKEIAARYESDFLGVIPYDKSVTQAQMKGLSVVEYADSPVTMKIKEIWEAVRICLSKDESNEGI